MRILALDHGRRRTGVAFCDTNNGVAVALDTIIYESPEELLEKVVTLFTQKKADLIVLGLPLLLGGGEGEQSGLVRAFSKDLGARGCAVELLDERYTTFTHIEIDGDAAAAVSLLNTYVDRLLTKAKNDIN